MGQALNGFLERVDSIERTLDLRDQLITFGQGAPEGLPTEGAELHRLVRGVGQAGMQPSLDGAVLLLAAALEQLVSDVIIAYAANLPNVYSNYTDLPDAVRSANERLTGEALSFSSSRFADYDLRRFVGNLSICNSGDLPYVLNGEALALNNRNLTSGILRELTSRLGVGNVWELMGPTEVLKEWYGSESADAAQSHAQNQLKELIDTRNQIAHRVGSANPGPDVVRSFLLFAKVLARSLVESLQNHSDSLSIASITTTVNLTG